MLRTLLAERFKMTLHRETKEGTTYALVLAKGGSKMKEDGDAANASFQQINGGSVRAHAVPMSMWARNLTRLTRRPVVDETGLNGRYDFTMTWTPDASQPMSEKDAATPVDATGATLFTALQEPTRIEAGIAQRADRDAGNRPR
jgi:uncharacterized protein (TIGR03435 family)